MSNFDKAFDVVVGQEGGYVNDPRDPGGETNWGICKRDHREIDIKSLTKDNAKIIYQNEYWNRMRCDQLPWPLCLYVFDAAVNQGVTGATIMLQRALGVADDGILGPKTLSAALTSSPEQWALFMAERSLRYVGTSTWATYGKGWMKRLFVVAGSA